MRLQGTPYCSGGGEKVRASERQWDMVTGHLDRTHFFSLSLERTKRVKFLSSMKPIINAMAPPTAEAMMMVRVLSTDFTTASTKHRTMKKEKMDKRHSSTCLAEG